MATPQSEWEDVPLTPKEKRQNTLKWSLLSGLSAALLIYGLSAKDAEHRLLTYCSIAYLVYGLWRLRGAIMQKTERRLTKAAWIQLQDARIHDRGSRRQRVRRIVALSAKIILALVMVVLAVWAWRPVGDAFTGKITVYASHCEKFASNGECEQDGWRSGGPTTYTVHTEQQFVIGMTDGDSAPHKLFNCVIADKTHWTCTTEPRKGSTVLTMNGADFSADDGSRYVSRFEWLFE
jgi:hypothetical protein